MLFWARKPSTTGKQETEKVVKFSKEQLDNAWNEYRRVEYAREWDADVRQALPLPLGCEPRIRFGI